ncbi:hypothetical protein [Frigoriglobus tundricola]|uniref:Cytochrome c domain-containing protein n=1 Tax=Frigoriglobus tundricola TaxID=2774151 RepID=A0A6M5YJ30_9BACT|nr:hypothetical protein [Frigoriglobus tundricola]QJW93564.1 hypothetical protein FTUN_1071 [Frigoriglobus tundricola]
MLSRLGTSGSAVLLISALACVPAGDEKRPAGAGEKPDPFAASSTPLPAGYKGPKYAVSHDYPTEAPPAPNDPPWRKALNGAPIGPDTAVAYMSALKEYVTKDIKTLVLDYANWDAGKARWYNMPWLYSIQDPVHGTYPAGEFPSSMFPLSGLKTPGDATMNTYVVVYYNDTAGYTLGQIWGKDAAAPDLTKAQYREGAIVVKVCLSSATRATWGPMDGAALWDVYGVPPNAPSGAKPAFFQGSVFQVDLIVKDSKTAPQTGWVFGTLVYDKSVPGDAWDKLIPLGAMWGNDPDVNSAANPNAILKQSVVNPVAPLYAVETLGYGGRLSGPNDGAVVQNAIVDGAAAPRVAASSCLSCHSTAEWQMQSFLLPSPSAPQKNRSPSPDVTSDGFLYVYKPGTVEFNRWFQNRLGNVPKDPGSVALDFHMNLAFKALPLWAKATQPSTRAERSERSDPALLLKTGLPPRMHR